MRRLALLAALLGGCDDGGDVAPDAQSPPGDMRVAVDARPTDMRLLDAQIDPDAAAPADMGEVGADMGDMGAGPDAALGDAGEPAADSAVDMAPADCVATVAVGDFEIFQFEASRIDATADAPGADATTVCSRAGVLPWTDVDLAGARAACARVGFSVCSGAQWQQACVGPELWPYPYGPEYMAGTCNDHVAGSGAIEVCGARPACAGPTGIHDQNGNVWELTDDAQRRGASFKLTASMFRPEAGACEAGFVVADGFFGRDVGFRCCR